MPEVIPFFACHPGLSVAKAWWMPLLDDLASEEDKVLLPHQVPIIVGMLCMLDVAIVSACVPWL